MVLVVLAVAWGSVLIFWLRSRSKDGAFTDSVGTFHRHLRILGRAAPGTLAPANRLRDPLPAGRPLRPVPAYAGRPVAAYAGRPLAAVPHDRPSGASAARRRQIRRRRRDVLFVLLVAVVALLVLFAGTGSHALLLLQLLSDAALAGYIGLLVRLRNLAAEREHKLRVLHQPRVARYPVAPAYADYGLRRVAN